MHGRTPYEAVYNFRSVLQRSISCITPDVILIHGASYHPSSEHALILGGTEPAKLSGTDISLSVRLYVRITEYDGEWRSPVTTPHLHLGAGANVGRAELQKAHIPTGLIELEDVLLLAIREFGAKPRRDDWTLILTRE